MPTRNGAAPEPIADLTPKQQANFERDFVRLAKGNPEVRKAGRKYLAYGWRALYDAVIATKRRRKAPGECHNPSCRCAMHEVTAVRTNTTGFDGADIGANPEAEISASGATYVLLRRKGAEFEGVARHENGAGE